MNERERWIVYPLLFLALGAALRDKLVDRTTTKSIVCQELSIVDEDAANPQLQRTLVRIGRAKPKAGGKSTGYLQLNGDMELVDDDLSENSWRGTLVKLGRTDPRPGVLSAGYAIVRGEMAIEGVLGARQYVWQGIPILPMQLVPGMAIPGMLQAVPPPGAKLPNQSVPKSQSPGQPAAAGAPKGQTVAPPSSPAGKESDSEK